MKLYIATDRDGMDFKNGANLSTGAVLEKDGGPDIGHIPVAWNTGLKYPEVAVFVLPFFLTDPWDEAARHVRIWECEGDGRTHDDGLRICATEVTVLAEYPFARPTPDQYRAFAVVCGISKYAHPEFIAWTNQWLKGNDPDQTQAKILYERMYEEDHFDVPGRAAAAAALASVLAPNGAERLRTPEYHAAAAGWCLHGHTGGKVSLLPAAKFALDFTFTARENTTEPHSDFSVFQTNEIC